jgi:hypothetical protein
MSPVRNTATTFYKQKSLINAKIKDFSEQDLEAINGLYGTMQKYFNSNNILGEEVLKGDRKFRFRATSLKDIFGVKRSDYISEIRAILKSLNTKEVTLNKYISVVGGVDYNLERHRTLLDGWDVIKNTNGSVDFDITFNEIFLQLIFKDYNLEAKNYTKIDYLIPREIRSRYGKRILEKLISNKYRSEFDMSLAELQNLFSMEDKPLSLVVRNIANCYDQVNEKMAFDYTVHKKDKKVTFRYL